MHFVWLRFRITFDFCFASFVALAGAVLYIAYSCFLQCAQKNRHITQSADKKSDDEGRFYDICQCFQMAERAVKEGS